MNHINERRKKISFDLYNPQPLVVVISGPSGVGKDAVLKTMQARGLPFHFVVTMTSRAPRDDEVHGIDYLFTTKEHFEQMIREDGFIEHALVYQDYKGVPKYQIRDALASGKDVILRLDVQGAATFRQLCPEAVLIFLIPEDEEEWMERLQNRKSETAESLALRIETAHAELERIDLFDYVVINAHDRLEEAVDTIANIIDAEHHRVHPRKSCL